MIYEAKTDIPAGAHVAVSPITGLAYVYHEDDLARARALLADGGPIKPLDTLRQAQELLRQAIIAGANGPAFELLESVERRVAWYALPPLQRALEEAKEIKSAAEDEEHRLVWELNAAEKILDGAADAYRAALHDLARGVVHYAPGCTGYGGESPFCPKCDPDNYNKWRREFHGPTGQTIEEQFATDRSLKP